MDLILKYMETLPKILKFKYSLLNLLMEDKQHIKADIQFILSKIMI